MNREHFLGFFLVLALGVAFGCGEESGGDSPDSPSDAGTADAQSMSDMTMTQVDAQMVPTCRIDDQCEANEYCFEAEDGTKRCRSGCREDGCEEGRICDLTLRVCVRDTSCEDDDGCFFGEYCDSGLCVDGCRLE
ncbi:MAG: hypothetical protein ACPGQS_11160, partial [Bradymonadia bacterium]